MSLYSCGDVILLEITLPVPFGTGMLQISIVPQMGNPEGVKMRNSLYPHGIYLLLPGDIKTITAQQPCGRCVPGMLWDLRLGVCMGK